jgi:hypothetical protein
VASGGVVMRVGDELSFLPANVAMKIMAVPDVARVPGGPRELLGVAIVDGETLPVIAASEARPSAMVVLQYMGERIGLVGVDVVATGRFEPLGDGVKHEGVEARPFDLAALVGRVRETRWAV